MWLIGSACVAALVWPIFHFIQYLHREGKYFAEEKRKYKELHKAQIEELREMEERYSNGKKNKTIR